MKASVMSPSIDENSCAGAGVVGVLDGAQLRLDALLGLLQSVPVPVPVPRERAQLG